MHLLYIIKDPYPTARPDVLVLFGQRLPARGFTSDIVGVAGPPQAGLPKWPAGAEFVTSNDGPRVLALVRAFVAEWRRFTRPTGYDGIVFRDRTLSAAAAIASSGRHGPPIHYWMSYPFPEDDLVRSRVALRGPLFRLALAVRGRLFRWLLYGYVIPRAAHVFVQSDRMLEVVKQRSGRTTGFTAVPMGVDERMVTDPAIQGRSRPLRPGETLSLVYLGSLDRARNIEFLLNVLVELRRVASARPVELTLIGSASTQEETDWLAARIDALGVRPWVRMTGAMPMRDAWSLCRQSHIGLSAIPRGELFDVSSPTKTVEYLAMALPVVVNDIPDQELLIRATGAGLCTTMTASAFASAILAVADDHTRFADAALRARDWVVAHRGYDSLSEQVASVLAQAASSGTEEPGRTVAEQRGS